MFPQPVPTLLLSGSLKKANFATCCGLSFTYEKTVKELEVKLGFLSFTIRLFLCPIFFVFHQRIDLLFLVISTPRELLNATHTAKVLWQSHKEESISF